MPTVSHLNHSKPETWSIRKLTDAQRRHPEAGEHLELPRFQRAIVWKKAQREALIESIYRGFPIGALLLYRLPAESSDAAQVYQLVDGLQRTTAIISYTDEPLTYAPAAALPSDVVERLTKELQAHVQDLANLEDEVRSGIIEWMRQTKKLSMAEGFTPESCVNHLLERLDADIDQRDERKELVDTAARLLDGLRDGVDIGDVSVPVIVYTGPKGNLPEIFELINSSGTKLSKYQIYAATWIDQQVDIQNERVKKAIEEKYQTILDRGFDIQGLEDDGEINEFSLFEYLFGLGKVLSEDFPRLFGPPTEAADTQPMAFTMATIAHRLRLNDMGALPQEMLRDSEKRISPSSFEEALLKSCKFVEDCLFPYFGIKLNQQGGSPLVVHTDYQIASLVVRVMVARWQPNTWVERDEWQQEWEQLKTTIPQYYLYDIIQQNWRGSGDSRLYDMAWHGRESDESRQVSGHYLNQIPRKQWEDALNAWHEEQLLRQQRSRPHVRGVEKLFLKFVYAGIVSHLDEHQKSFEVEHLFPVKRLRDLIGEHEEGWPISAVANLALFEKSLNREKLKLTISEYLDNQDDEELRQAVEPYLLVDVDTVSIPEDGEYSKDDYLKFLRRRFEPMKKQVLDKLGVLSET